TEAVAVDGGDGDRVKIFQGRHAALPCLEPITGQISLCQFFCIQPTTKSSALSTHDHNVHPGLLRQVAGGFDKVLYPCPVCGIQRLWTIQAQSCYWPIQFTAHCLKFK